MTATERASARMQAEAPRVIGRMIRREAERLSLKTEDDMARKMLGPFVPKHFTVFGLLDRAKAGYASERARGRSGHWSHDFNRMLAWAGIAVECRRRIAKAGGFRREAAWPLLPQ